ncbi:MAG: hypothetical protein EOM50_01270 [Erysipelotrichia bacterium]|nr:hypothetical protein [Erysipelotrichia bacterium]NCC54757.1 hypothetical protein [Erysipelotrichia bacterium]
MKTNISAEVLESIVPISDLNRGGAAKVIDTITDQNSERIIVRNNKPVAILMNVDRYLNLLHMEDGELKIYSHSEIKSMLKQFCINNKTYGEAINEVYLFGSYARGDATFTSDIDLLIDINKEKINSNVKNIELMNLHKVLTDYFNKSVDIIYTTYIPEKLKNNIEEDKVKIYG